MTQRLGDEGRAGRDAKWRHMENEGRREEAMRRIATKAKRTAEEPETEIIDIIGPAEAEEIPPEGAGGGRRPGTTGKPTRGGVGGGRRKWRSGEYLRYCREMKIDMWEGAWRRAGEEILPRRGVG